MSERLFSVLMVIAGVYGGAHYAVAKNYDMAAIFGALTLLAIWTVHAVWTAPVFHEGD
jgi:hypothetical protein